MGTIQKVARAKPWRVRYRGPDGSEVSRTFRVKVDAERWLREQESKLDRGAWVDPSAGRVTFAEYADGWMAGRSLKPKTRAGYASLLKSRILPIFGNVPLNRITPDQVRSWVVAMEKGGLSASRIKQARALLQQVLGQAVGDGILGRNAALGVTTPRKRPRRQRFLTPDQVEAVANACESRLDGAGALVRFLAWSGLRWGEVVALTARNVDVERRRVRVRESATEVNGELVFGEPKTHEHRTVVVPRFIFDGLKPGDGLVFTAPRGGPLRVGGFRKVWKPAVEECGLTDLVVHDLRDTAASLAIASGASIKAVQRMLGHASAAMTLDVYGGLYDDDLEELADRLEDRHAAHMRHKGENTVRNQVG